MIPRILFITKKRIDSYGISYGLVNSAAFIVKTLNDFGIEAKLTTVVDANGIDREVTRSNPTHVFIEALWVTPAKFRELLHRHKKRIWVNRIHSKAPFIANEGIALPWIVEYRQIMKTYSNFFISCNSKEFNENLNTTMHIGSIYLPNIYNPPKYAKGINLNVVQPILEPYGDIRFRKVIDIGCFGAIRPLKNQLIQAIAAIRFGDEMGFGINFHINGGRCEQSGENVVKNLRALFFATPHKLVEHLWMPHDEFIDVVRSMDMGMQVSFSETFNIVAADFVSQNIPMVVSYDVDWMPSIFKANPNCADSIVNKLKIAYYGSFLGLQNISRLALWWSNLKAKSIWYNYVQESWIDKFFDHKH
jgi:hypothetical protein